MKKDKSKLPSAAKREDTKKSVSKPGKNFLPAYPSYPVKDDIYSRDKEETELDPENPKQIKKPNEKFEGMNEKDFPSDVSGSDLDIPGAELDDAQEDIGSEDEENNYYSLGGDKHDNP